jgi:hypothetical protein
MEQQNQEWSNDMDTLDTFSTATAQLEYIMTQLAPFLGETASDCLAWRGYDMNIISEVFDSDISTMSNSYNDVLKNGEWGGAPGQNIQDVDTAMGAANQALWYAFTCPEFSNNTDLQTQLVNNMSDFFECDPTYSTYMITVDGQSQSVSVPQFDPNAVTNPIGDANDVNTADHWAGGFWDGPSPGDQEYNAYLSSQSQWNQDLTMMSDSCDTLSVQTQAMMQQNTTIQQEVDGMWNNMIQEKTKGVAYQINQENSGS